MVKIQMIPKLVEKFVADRSPEILTAIGVTGTITTAYLAGKASFKAAEIIRQDRETATVHYEPTLKTDMQLVWRLYIPAVGAGVTTVSAIICAARINSRRTAAMAAAYSISEKAFSEYKEKVVEKFGQSKEQDVRDSIAQDRVSKNPASREVIITGEGEVLCYDSISGRYFQSSVEKLRKAMNDINHQIINEMYASLYEFYNLIGLSPTPYSTEVGWNADHLLEISFSTVLSEDGRPCVSVDYDISPIRDYFRLQ